MLLENLAGSGFKDFIYFGPGAGQSHVERVHGVYCPGSFMDSFRAKTVGASVTL